MNTPNALARQRLRHLTPETLREYVTSHGGTITRESDYRYTPDQGGDGERGVLGMTFADATGREVGNIGFSRYKDTDGQVRYSASDYSDDPDTNRGEWIHVNAQGLIDILAALAPTEG